MVVKLIFINKYGENERLDKMSTNSQNQFQRYRASSRKTFVVTARLYEVVICENRKA